MSCDIVAIGNALVDQIALVEDDFLIDLPLERGGMTFVSQELQKEISLKLQKNKKNIERVAGGSVANTLWTMQLHPNTKQSLFYCHIGADDLGRFFAEECKKQLIHCASASISPTQHSEKTGTCIVLTTPNGDRTMATYLGTSALIEPQYFNFEEIAAAKIVICEGFLYASEGGRNTCGALMQKVKKYNQTGQNQINIALSLSDANIVKDNRDLFLKQVHDYQPILFCNEQELCALFDNDDISFCINALKECNELSYVTRDKKGAMCIFQGGSLQVRAHKVNVISTNGAGDTFAGAVLSALFRQAHPNAALQWGNKLAAQVVQRHAPRLESMPENLIM